MEGGRGEQQNTVKNGKKGGGIAAPERGRASVNNNDDIVLSAQIKFFHLFHSYIVSTQCSVPSTFPLNSF